METKDYGSIHYKENSPERTVDKLIGILADYGMEVEENWLKESEIDTYSLRLTIKGTNIGTNGKGVSKEYARASAYGEFFERYQNELLWKEQWTSGFGKASHDGIVYSAEELVDTYNPMLNYYFKKKKIKSRKKKIENIKDMENMEEFVTGKRNQYSCVTFFHLNSKSEVYMPQSIYMPIYGSNGMCAGNTREEALVQGLSEIIERVVQKKIFIDKISCPNIPDSVIQKYPYIWKMYKKMKSNPELEVALKDCSFGGKYPVVALVVMRKNTGTYGVKLGCHPIISIAMERTMTEATQGQSINSYASMNNVDFYNTNVSENFNIENSMKVGIAQYPYEFLCGKPDYEYFEYNQYSLMSNADILNRWIKEIIDDGNDVLIRDVSHLGFPAYHIIIPSLSEMREISDDFNRKMNTRVVASWLLKNREKINENNCKYILGAIHKFAFDIQENNVKEYFHVETSDELPGSECGSESWVLCSLCYATIGDYKLADIYINKVIGLAIEKKSEKLVQYLAIHYYFSLRSIGKGHTDSITFLTKMFSFELVEMINITFKKSNMIIFYFYNEVGNKKESESFLQRYIDIYQDVKKKKKINQKELGNILAS